MIIKSITLKDFFRVYGEIKILCSTDSEKNVTVIKGDNGTGKTTMLSAFHWAFYGNVIEPLTTDEMLNKRKRSEMQENETSTASVRVELTDKGIDYIFLREQEFRKNGDGSISKIGEPKVLITNLSSTPPSTINNKNFFENIIPKKLSGFFFFDGERIDRLAKIDGKNEIKQAILDLLGLTNINNIKNYLNPIKMEFNKELGKLSANTETADLTNKLSNVLENIEYNKEQLDKIETRIKEYNKVKEDCESYLKTHNVDQVRRQELRREELEKETNSINNTLADDSSRIFKHISKNLKTYLISDSFENISEFLEDKRRKKQLPSDIKETFINDLLESKTCICGRPLIEGHAEYNTIKKLKETAGKQELDDCYSRLVSFINYSDNKTIKDSFFSEIYQYKQKEHVGAERKAEIKKELEKIKKELNSFDDSLIQAKEELLEQAKSMLDDLKIKHFQGKQAIETLKTTEKDLNTKISKAEDKSKGAILYKKASALTSDLEALTNRINEFFIDITQQDMDTKLKEVFSILTRKQDREPLLSKNFELQIVNKETQKNQLLSTGERQITSLSFIGAIVSYARDKYSMGLMSDFSGGDYPIIMDSPFGNLDPTHKENVAKGIPALASQVIVIVSEGQWSGIVSDSMAAKVGGIYEMSDGYTSTPDSEFTEIRRIS